MAHQAGFDNVVASLGTALTPDQVGLLTRYANRIALAYDVDPAGEKAGTFGVTALTGLIGQLQADDSGVKLEDVRVVRLPDGKDPDEVIREEPEGLGGRRREGQAARRIPDRPSRRRFDLKQSAGRIGFVEAVIPGGPGHRGSAPPRRGAPGGPPRIGRRGARACARCSSGAWPRSGPVGNGVGTRITADAVLASPDALPVDDILRAVTPVESELLRLLLLVPDQQVRVADELGPDQLPSTLARELYRAIVLQRAPNDQGVHPPFDGAALLLAVDDETASLARALYAKSGPDPRDARTAPARVRDRAAAARARRRPAARPQRLQRSRSGRGRTRR